MPSQSDIHIDSHPTLLNIPQHEKDAPEIILADAN